MDYKNNGCRRPRVIQMCREKRLPETGSRILKKIRDIPKEKKWNMLLALSVTLLVFMPVVLNFDFYYDLNDDVLIKDILSGVYSKTPAAHTMQILYPLALLLSLLYQVLSIPVFGVFLVLCQFGSIYLIAYRTAWCLKKWQEKVLALLAEGVFWMAAFLGHLVFVQYTVAAGMLASAAIFWMLTSESAVSCSAAADDDVCEEKKAGIKNSAFCFLRANIPALVLYWIAFCLRSEMALLLLPLAGVAGLCKWGQERSSGSWIRGFFSKENVCRYLTTFGALMLGIVLCQGIDELAYRDEDWSAFRQYFDARTELYDYQKDFIDDYESNAAYYEAAGVSQVQHALLDTYNFGVDDSIDEKLLTALQEQSAARPGAGGLFKKSIAEGLWDLCRGHWLSGEDAPYNIVLWLCGILALALGIRKGHRYLLWQVPLCFGAGSVLWMFLLLRGRPVDRVLHPLYLGQILVFAGLLLLEWKQEQKQERKQERKFAAPVLVLGISCSIFVLPSFSAVSEEYADREATNQTNEAVMDYCMSHSNRLFLEDVYSTVYYSEKIGVDRNKPFNYDLLGGWLVKSPLTEKKMRSFGYATMGEAVRAGNNVSLLVESGNGLAWLTDYFTAEGLQLQVVKTGEITEGVEIWQVLPESTGESIK